MRILEMATIQPRLNTQNPSFPSFCQLFWLGTWGGQSGVKGDIGHPDHPSGSAPALK